MKVERVDWNGKLYYSVKSEDEFYDMEAWGAANNVGIHYFADSRRRWVFSVSGDDALFLLRWL